MEVTVKTTSVSCIDGQAYGAGMDNEEHELTIRPTSPVRHTLPFQPYLLKASVNRRKVTKAERGKVLGR